jgi:hypothetical protein
MSIASLRRAFAKVISDFDFVGVAPQRSRATVSSRARRNRILAKSATLVVGAMLASTAKSASATTTLIESWENTLDGWQVPAPAGSNSSFTPAFSTTTGVTNGSYSLAITGTTSPNYTQMLISPSTTVLTQDLGVATAVTLDVDTPAGSFGGYLQFDCDINNSNTGFVSLDSYSYPATTIGSETTLTFTLPAGLAAQLAASSSPTSIDFQIGGGYSAGNETMYLDNLSIVGGTPPPPPPTFTDETANWALNGSGNWEVAANWNPNTAIPGAAGSQITFDNNAGAITANPTVTLSNSVAATLLTFGNASGGTAVNYTIASGAAGAGIAVSSEIDADSGSHVINVPVSTSSGNFYFGIATGASLSIPSFADSSYGAITVTSPLSNQTAGGTLSLGATLHCNLTDDGTAITFLPGSGGFIYGLNVNTGSVVNLGANTWNTNSIASDGTGEIIVPTGGILYTGEYTSGTVTYSGTFGGGGSIVVGEGGSTDTTPSTLALYGNNSAFTGTMTAGSTSAAGAFTLAVGAANNLGSGASSNYVILDGGILQALGMFIATQNVVVTANGGTIDTDGPGVGANGTGITLGAISSTAIGATLKKINTGILTTTSIRGVGLSISGGITGAASTVQIAPNNGTLAGAQAGVSVLTSLTIENTGSYTSTLDLTNNSLIIQNGGTANAASAAVASTVAAEIASGRNNNAQGLWTGTGITSSLAAANPTLTAVGMIYNDNGSGTPLKTSFEGQTVSDGDVLVKYTYDGDANLDGTVNGSDYALIDNAYNEDQAYLAAHPSGTPPLTGWQNGDFNYDGQINGDDYALIDNAFNMEGSVTFAGTSAGPAEMIAGDTEQVASPAVPEPTTLTLIAMGAAGSMIRRRRRKQV